MLGRVMTVAGSLITVELDESGAVRESIRVGTMVKVSTGDREIIASISKVESENAKTESHILTADLVGELAWVAGRTQFSRGVSVFPVPGEPVFPVSDADRSAIYGEPSQSNFRVGTLYQDATRPALIQTNELLEKHFAVLGTTGAGKSCATTLILSAILEKHPNAHIVLMDPHNEYATAFGDLADSIRLDNLQLPFWLLNYEEAAKILIRSGSESEQASQALILNDAMTFARREYKRKHYQGAAITADTPLPFRMHDLLRFVNDEMGRLTKPDTATPYLRLRSRIESLRDDKRFAFLFSSEEDDLAKILGRLMRVPVEGKPIAIVDLSGVPSDIADVIVSTLSRVLFDFSVWCEQECKPPVLLVCEEAHRYVPADVREGFAQTVQVITRIAKEGRKYGMALALITQRPSELSLAALSQCGTVFALRLGSESDQAFIARTLPDVARGMLSALPSLPMQQAIVSGEGVRIPMRICFDDLPEERRPRSESVEFSGAWQTDVADAEFIERGIHRWRSQIRG